ncbi:hypothetical protein APHAL10511_006485 [Amanita phalloides]|nr:hypothetical protein APHAL10511_006485 [Amanita phalloides]
MLPSSLRGRDVIVTRFVPLVGFLLLSFLGFYVCLTILQDAPRRRTRKLDIQAHRGGRANTIENTLPSFAWGLINGASTLELDNGITKDGVVVVWHDQSITDEKCQDTTPAFEGDPDFPYIGKYIVNLTLAQIKTLDCGSKRLHDFPLQLTYPGTRISTLKELFDFAKCADPEHKVQWNIESKINASHPDRTHDVDMFVTKQYEAFVESSYPLSQIIYQSLDWRTLIAMKKLDPRIKTSALISPTTLSTANGTTSPWQAGIRIGDLPGPSVDVKIADGAQSVQADILSPAVGLGSTPFTTRAMIERARELDMQVIPWTVNDLATIEQLVEWGTDGVITDHPGEVRRWAWQQGYGTGLKYASDVLRCLA